MKKILAVMALFISAVLCAQEGGGTFTVAVDGFRSDNGCAILGLLREGDKMQNDGFISKKAEIKNGRCTFAIDKLDDGVYAVKIYHDENSNGKMDMGLMKIEGIGVSRNIRLKGHPKFEEVAITVDNDHRNTAIKMQYLKLSDVIKGGIHHGN